MGWTTLAVQTLCSDWTSHYFGFNLACKVGDHLKTTFAIFLYLFTTYLGENFYKNVILIPYPSRDLLRHPPYEISAKFLNLLCT